MCVHRSVGGSQLRSCHHLERFRRKQRGSILGKKKTVLPKVSNSKDFEGNFQGKRFATALTWCERQATSRRQGWRTKSQPAGCSQEDRGEVSAQKSASSSSLGRDKNSAVLLWQRAAHSRVLAWRIPVVGEPGGLPSVRSHRVGHNWSDLAAAAASFHVTFWDFNYMYIRHLGIIAMIYESLYIYYISVPQFESFLIICLLVHQLFVLSSPLRF